MKDMHPDSILADPVDTVQIDKDELYQLRQEALMLTCLEAVGVCERKVWRRAVKLFEVVDRGFSKP